MFVDQQHRICGPNGAPLTFFHGTGQPFLRHDTQKARSALNASYQGDWICYSTELDVAKMYSVSARNQVINHALFFDVLSRKMRTTLPQHSVSCAIELLQDVFEIGDKSTFERWRQARPHDLRLVFDTPFPTGASVNDACDWVAHLERNGQPSANVQVSDNMSLDGLDTSIPYSVFNDLRDAGMDSVLPLPRVVVSHISARSLIYTKDREECQSLLVSGRPDVIVFSGSDCVEGLPEILVASDAQVRPLYHLVSKIDDEQEIQSWEQVSMATVRQELLSNGRGYVV
ncbi:hypothetical protein AB6D11_00395 [Vibrio splendidus]